MAKKLAMLFGIVFVLVGALGFISNPIVGEGGYFQTALLIFLPFFVSSTFSKSLC